MPPPLAALHTDFLEDLEIGQGRSQKTIANYDHYLQRFYCDLNIQSLADITQDAVRSFRRHLSAAPGVASGRRPDAGLALATQNYHLIALRQFLKYLAKRDISALAPEKIGLAKLGERDIDVLYPEEIEALLAATESGMENKELGQPPITDYSTPPSLRGAGRLPITAQRDAALVHTLFSTGLRISETVRLNRDDVRQDSNEVVVRGKGNKVRVVFLSPQTRTAIAAYLAQRTDIHPALFIRHTAGGTGAHDELRLTSRSMQRLIKKYAARAGLTKQITPHTLRHSFATDLLANGADVRQVQQLLGHASITTTQLYTHLTDVHLRDVHEKFHRKKG